MKFYHDVYVKHGFEGLMIRKLAGSNPTKTQLKQSWYKGKKNDNLLKFKLFFEAEGTVIAVNEGKGKFAGLAVFRLRTDSGKEFDCTPAATEELKRKWYQERDQLIGKRYTYRYQELTEYGIPRFPVGKGFRDYE